MEAVRSHDGGNRIACGSARIKHSSLHGHVGEEANNLHGDWNMYKHARTQYEFEPPQHSQHAPGAVLLAKRATQLTHYNQAKQGWTTTTDEDRKLYWYSSSEAALDGEKPDVARHI